MILDCQPILFIFCIKCWNDWLYFIFSVCLSFFVWDRNVSYFVIVMSTFCVCSLYNKKNTSMLYPYRDMRLDITSDIRYRIIAYVSCCITVQWCTKITDSPIFFHLYPHSLQQWHPARQTFSSGPGDVGRVVSAFAPHSFFIFTTSRE